jgi:ABC-type transport system involved in multi-copper enzyme maturation permease subunit
MSTLLWKEWHEQRWKLGFGCLILGAFAVIGLHARVVADETLMLWTCLLAILLLPVLSSTGLMPAERAEGSFETLLSLPVRPWRVFLAKTLMGVALCVGPLLIAALLSLAMASGREMDASSIIVLYARSIAATLSLFAWMLALTIRLPNEMRAGLLALGVLIFWLLASAGLIALSDRQQGLPAPVLSLWTALGVFQQQQSGLWRGRGTADGFRCERPASPIPRRTFRRPRYDPAGGLSAA